MLYVNSKTNLQNIFLKSVFDFMIDFILGAQISCAQNRYTVFWIDLKYPLMAKWVLVYSSFS